jgi:hypothetical protein
MVVVHRPIGWGMGLRKDLAKLAHDNPELRERVVPLLRKEAFNKENPIELLSQLVKVLAKQGFGALASAVRRSDLMHSVQEAVDRRSGVADMSPEERSVWLGRVASRR